MEHKSIDELRNYLAEANNRVSIRNLYRHSKSGGIYKVEGFNIMEVDNEVVVRYSSVDVEDIEFIRPLREFIEVVSIDGKMQPRFQIEIV